jgi:hypothetical protein
MKWSLELDCFWMFLKMVLRCFFCGSFDASDKRAHYVLMPFKSDDDWKFYKELVKGVSSELCGGHSGHM